MTAVVRRHQDTFDGGYRLIAATIRVVPRAANSVRVYDGCAMQPSIYLDIATMTPTGSGRALVPTTTTTKKQS